MARFVKRYRRQKTKNALGLLAPIFTIDFEEVIPGMAAGRL